MADTKLNEGIALSRYVKCNYDDGTKIVIGRLDNGDLILSIEKEINNQIEEVTKIILPQANMTGILVAMLIYAEAYGIDLSAKIKELLDSNNVFYFFKE